MLQKKRHLTIETFVREYVPITYLLTKASTHKAMCTVQNSMQLDTVAMLSGKENTSLVLLKHYQQATLKQKLDTTHIE